MWHKGNIFYRYERFFAFLPGPAAVGILQNNCSISRNFLQADLWRHPAEMRIYMITLWRIFLASWKNLFRNAWIGLATVFVFFLALLSVNILLGVNVLLGRVIGLLEQKVDVTITFKETAPEAVISQARFYLESLPQVGKLTLISREEALAQFKARHAGDTKVLAALAELEENPLGAQIVIKAKNADDYPFLLQAVQNPQYAAFIQKRTYDDHKEAIEHVRNVSRQGKMVGAALVALFVFFGALIAFNAIRVAIYTQREEIAIMRLVGASSSFIRGPFILEGIWLALVSLALAFSFLFLMIYWLDPRLRGLLDGMDPGLFAFFFQQRFQLLLLEAILLSGLVSLVSWAAVGKYIKR